MIWKITTTRHMFRTRLPALCMVTLVHPVTVSTQMFASTKAADNAASAESMEPILISPTPKRASQLGLPRSRSSMLSFFDSSSQPSASPNVSSRSPPTFASPPPPSMVPHLMISSTKLPDSWSAPMRVLITTARKVLERNKDNIALARILSMTKYGRPYPPTATRITPVVIPRRQEGAPEGLPSDLSTGTLTAEWVEYRNPVAAIVQPLERKKSRSSMPPSNLAAHDPPSLPPVEEAPVLDPTRMVNPGDVIEAVQANPSERVILFIHGGAYFMCSRKTHRPLTWKYAKLSGAKVFAIDYRLSPEYVFPAALHDAISAYMYLVDPPPITVEDSGIHAAVNSFLPFAAAEVVLRATQASQPPTPPVRYSPNQIIICGDSAGGNLATALLLWLRSNAKRLGLGMPAGGVLMSPWLDLTHSMPSFVLHGDVDLLPYASLDPKYITQNRSQYYVKDNTFLRNPLVSPVFASIDDRNLDWETGKLGIDSELEFHTKEAPANVKAPDEVPTDEEHATKDNSEKCHQNISNDITPLPPLLIQCGSSERLYHEILHFASTTLAQSPAPVTLEVYEHMTHVHQLLQWEPLARLAQESVGKFVIECTSRFVSGVKATKSNISLDPESPVRVMSPEPIRTMSPELIRTKSPEPIPEDEKNSNSPSEEGPRRRASRHVRMNVPNSPMTFSGVSFERHYVKILNRAPHESVPLEDPRAILEKGTQKLTELKQMVADAANVVAEGTSQTSQSVGNEHSTPVVRRSRSVDAVKDATPIDSYRDELAAMIIGGAVILPSGKTEPIEVWAQRHRGTVRDLISAFVTSYGGTSAASNGPNPTMPNSTFGSLLSPGALKTVANVGAPAVVRQMLGTDITRVPLDVWGDNAEGTPQVGQDESPTRAPRPTKEEPSSAFHLPRFPFALGAGLRRETSSSIAASNTAVGLDAVWESQIWKRMVTAMSRSTGGAMSWLTQEGNTDAAEADRPRKFEGENEEDDDDGNVPELTEAEKREVEASLRSFVAGDFEADEDIRNANEP